MNPPPAAPPPPDTDVSPPPRVLLVMPDQWPRALLRAALREAGYDAVGAPSLPAALRYPAQVSDRGPLRLVLVDQAVLDDEGAATLLAALLRRHQDPVPLLLARATRPSPPPPPGAAWRHVISRPASLGDLVAAVQAALPLPRGRAGPLDRA